MKYKRFEDLPVWKAVIQFAVRVYALSAREEFRGNGSLRDQLERAAVSLSKQHSRRIRTRHDSRAAYFCLHRPWICRGSTIHALPDRAFASIRYTTGGNLKPESEAVSISRQLAAWAASLQNSEIKGQRYLTDKSRRAAQAARERAQFLDELRSMQEETIAKVQSRNPDNQIEQAIHRGESEG